MGTIAICVVYLLIALIGMTLIKSGHSMEPFFKFESIGMALSFRTLIGIVFYGLSFIIFTFYVSKLQISIVMPVLSGVNSVLTLLVGLIIFKEHISIGQGFGIALVVIGTVLIGLL